MNHKHFKQIDSTQNYLNGLALETDQDYLITCDEQTKGHGQYQRQWDHCSGNLAMSFTLSPSDKMSLSSLEVGILICLYYEKKYQKKLQLKWPNDLIINGKFKCGGILINTAKNINKVIVGIGLNLTTYSDNSNYKTAAGCIFDEKIKINSEAEGEELYQFILDNRILSPFIINRWTALCCHENKIVDILEENKTYTGLFIGVSPDGAARIKLNSGDMKTIYSGSLTLL